MDAFGNNSSFSGKKMELQGLISSLVSGFYDFDADVVGKETGLSIPVANFQFKYIEPGIQF